MLATKPVGSSSLVSIIRSQIIGCGAYLPQNACSPTHELAKRVDTSDEWIVERTGIRRATSRAMAR